MPGPAYRKPNDGILASTVEQTVHVISSRDVDVDDLAAAPTTSTAKAANRKDTLCRVSK